MLNVRLAGDHLFGKYLFTWLSLVMSYWCLFVLSFFPRDVLDEIWDLIGSVSEGFSTYICANVRQHMWKANSTARISQADDYQAELDSNHIYTFQSQSTLVISTSVISNYRSSQRENLILVLT